MRKGKSVIGKHILSLATGDLAYLAGLYRDSMICFGPGKADRRLHGVKSIDLFPFFTEAVLTFRVILYVSDIKCGEDIRVERQDTFRLVEFIDRIDRRAKSHAGTRISVIRVDRLVLYPLRCRKLSF